MQITKIADGVYGAIYTDMIRDPVQSNAMIIIGDDGVCVVDSHYTPTAARATIAEIKKLTALPVKFVVTTHWHDDHIFGNQEYLAAFPQVQFVAQDDTRASMIAQASQHQQQLVKAYSAEIPLTEKIVATGLDAAGKPVSAADKAQYASMIPIYRAYLDDFSKVKVVLPTLTFDKEMTLYLGARQIVVKSFGAGNTKGDAVIWLPAEKIAAVGDLVVYPVPFIYGGYPAHWVDVLRDVRALQPTAIVPGHGPVMRDFTYIDRLSPLFEAMASQAKAAVARGLTLEEARKTFDLSAFRTAFIQGARTPEENEERRGTFDASIVRSGMKAAYDEAMEMKKGKS